MNTKEFFEALYGEDPLPGLLTLWTLQDKKTHWFRDLHEAANQAVELAAKKDVYFGIGIRREKKVKGRGAVKDIVAIPGVWSDIDIADPAHKKKNLPPTQADALGLVSSMGLEPSIIIHSGHGLQAWWLFKELWTFDQAIELEQAIRLLNGWNIGLRMRSRNKGWDADSTFDLARVFRPPGTINHKGKTPKDVMILLDDSLRRYNPSDFEKYMADPRVVPIPVRDEFNINLDPAAVPPFKKFNALIAAEPKFKLSWERKRKDLQDQSPSAYDMSLATYAFMAGWSDQEMVDLLIACRAHHGDDLKLRKDYYARTISKVKADKEQEEAINSLAFAEAGEASGEAESPESIRKETLGSLSKIFRSKVLRFTKTGKENAIYSITFEKEGVVCLGKSENLLNVSTVRNKVFEAIGVIIPRVKQDKWDKVVEQLVKVVEVELAEDSHTGQLMLYWLDQYLEEQVIYPEENWAEALEHNAPFIKDDYLHIHAEHMRSCLVAQQSIRLEAVDLRFKLQLLGFKGKTITSRTGEKSKGRYYWRTKTTELDKKRSR